jgi:outer membrane protein TolC
MALARVRASLAEAQQARLLPNPILSVALRWPEGGGGTIVEASVAAELLSLLKKPGQISAADDRLRAASSDAVAAVLDVWAELQDRYVEVQALDALVPVLEARRRLVERMRLVAQSRLGAGEGTRLDVTTLEAQLVELEVEIAERELERREARLALARLIGRPSDEAHWSIDAWAAPQEVAGSEGAWIASAMTHRPEIEAIAWSLQALGMEERLTGLAWLEGDEVGVDVERDDGWSVGPAFSLALPIFDWGQAGRANAQARRAEALHQLTATRRQVVEEVRRAHAAYVASHRVLEQVRDRLVPLLERREEEAESAYRAGQSDVLALILAQQGLQAGRARRIELERKTRESLNRLHRAVGGAGRAPGQDRTDLGAPETDLAQETTP